MTILYDKNEAEPTLKTAWRIYEGGVPSDMDEDRAKRIWQSMETTDEVMLVRIDTLLDGRRRFVLMGWHGEQVGKVAVI